MITMHDMMQAENALLTISSVGCAFAEMRCDAGWEMANFTISSVGCAFVSSFQFLLTNAM